MSCIVSIRNTSERDRDASLRADITRPCRNQNMFDRQAGCAAARRACLIARLFCVRR